ncbi:potassium channel family protein [Pseudomonas cichorii]|uniref:ion channel n=1 Tax=Pseudomonas TaxID=286 RepID=UPI000BA4AAD6|nr:MULTISPECIES: ion channel [Pseudomonas]MBX8508233.1 potassium channel family protein [Pseudomonas cichorii]MBX8523429.1 potassium channel family protein [Pseudomonas cichorii]MBX8533726.1 potassium channel family protein [Pseudomonas cichorii]MBX8542705.1 potassium channel family protein [Pseudomonas cichorii]MBX8578609.1 potassium channel family protein [Pseudomonas cichorii]
MTLFLLLRRHASVFFDRFGWAGIGILLAVHYSVSWVLLTLAGEEHLLQGVDFTYFYLTTATTVGYGDLSPKSGWGKVITTTWIMLGGIALLTAVIGKASTSVGDIWRRNMKGQGDCSALKGHTVLVGWDGESSERIVELLDQDASTSRGGLVICDSIIAENPMPGRASFIKGDSLDSPALLIRAGVIGAQRILVHTQSDSLTLAIVLTLKSLGPSGHVVAHFNNSERAALARTYAPELECTSDMAIEMLVRSSQDPGSSSVINELLCIGQGATQFRHVLPADFTSSCGELYVRLRQEFNATLIGYRSSASGQFEINPANDVSIRGGEIFYIASSRLQGDAL